MATLALPACVSRQIGPHAVPPARFGYNVEIARSADEQLLLNLVRLRYRDTPMFLEMGSIVTQYSIDRGVGASAGLKLASTTEGSFGASGSFSYSERPVVTYTPLQGETFAQRLLSPIDSATLVMLSRSGWSIERLLLACVQDLNGLKNAVGAEGPTPDYVPEFEEFHRVAALLRKLQLAGLLSVRVSEKNEVVIRLSKERGDPLDAEIREVRSRLALDALVEDFTVTMTKTGAPQQIVATSRSLLGTLYFLSQGVEVPEADERKGKVTVTKSSRGERFDWSRVVGRLLHVRSSEEPPADAAVRVPYRGHWFYVADDDLTSKSTFNLLGFLISLKSGSGSSLSPLLTIGR